MTIQLVLGVMSVPLMARWPLVILLENSGGTARRSHEWSAARRWPRDMARASRYNSRMTPGDRGLVSDAAVSIVGADAVRDGTAADGVDGVVPRLVLAPSTPEAVGAVLKWASSEKLTVVTRGAGSKLAYGAVPGSIDLLLSTERLNSVLAHRHGDLTATIQAGATLAATNRTLAQHRQWLPLDPPSADRATIGGIVATNDSGPRRHRYGAPRDLIIGVEFARADGELVKGGGIVVKNVAGYDLPRLLTGSFGSLGVIVSATFKLYPLTAASRTLVVELPRTSDLGSLVSRVLDSHLTPTALEFITHPLRALVRFESIEASVEQQTETATKLVVDCGFRAAAVSGADEDQTWIDHARFPGTRDGALLKISVLPGDLAVVLDRLDELAGATGFRAAGRAGAGVFLVHLAGDAQQQKRVIEGVRRALDGGKGSAVIVHASPELKSQIDVWGPIGDGLALMKAVKQQFDPAGILNRARGPGGM